MSLIMPVWRPREDWLRAAVDSALAQRDCDLELIVVDDGCERPVAELLADVHDPRLRLHRVTHGAFPPRAMPASRRPGGNGSAMLAGDADDVVSYGATTFCDENLRPLWTMRSRLQGRIAVDCLLGRFTVRPQALLFPRHVVEAAGGWESRFRASEDWDFVLRMLENTRARGETAVAVLYRRHPGGLTGDPDAAGRVPGSSSSATCNVIPRRGAPPSSERPARCCTH